MKIFRSTILVLMCCVIIGCGLPSVRFFRMSWTSPDLYTATVKIKPHSGYTLIVSNPENIRPDISKPMMLHAIIKSGAEERSFEIKNEFREYKWGPVSNDNRLDFVHGLEQLEDYQGKQVTISISGIGELFPLCKAVYIREAKPN